MKIDFPDYDSISLTAISGVPMTIYLQRRLCAVLWDLWRVELASRALC